MKIGIIGSRNYENKRKIKECIYKLKNKCGRILIASGGSKQGAEKYAKKYALELECEYLEFNPSHTPKNLYSALHENYYGKSYNPGNFFTRNTMLVKYCDMIIAFVPDGDDGKAITHSLNEAKKYGKKVVIIS